MPAQMVSRFRVKKLSPKHPLPIFKESQLPDLVDPANVQRSVPQIETGVEKEEEEEVCYHFIIQNIHTHLQIISPCLCVCVHKKISILT